MNNDFRPMRHVEMLHIGKVLSDSINGITGEKPVAVPGTASMGFAPNASVEPYKADGGTYDSATASGDITVNGRIAGLPLNMMGDLFGYRFDEGTKRLVLSDPNPADHFIKYRIAKNGGGWRYITIYKGKYVLGEQTASGEGTGFMDVSFSGTATKSRAEDGYIDMVDDDNLPAGVDASDIEKQWFESLIWSPDLPTLTGITVTASQASLPVGATETVAVTASYSDGSSVDVTKSCALASSDDTKLSVNNSGIITGVAAGTSLKVTAIYQGKMAQSANIAVSTANA